jgi:hypothetical protein
VAEDCGFNQLGLFNTCFKRRFGTTPGQWRKLNLKADRAPAPAEGVASACPLQINGLCPLSGHGRPDGHALPSQVAVPAKAGPTRFELGAKSPKRGGPGEKETGVGQQLTRKEPPRRVVVRISP